MANVNHKIPVTADTAGWEPTLHDQIVMELKTNGGLKRIQSTIRQRLDEAGWSEDLRKYVTAILRSGAAAKYNDVEDIILARIQAGAGEGSEGAVRGVTAPNLSIPIEAQRAGAEAVKKEIAGVVEMK